AVFKIGRSPLTRGGWVRLPGASANLRPLAFRSGFGWQANLRSPVIRRRLPTEAAKAAKVGLPVSRRELPFYQANVTRPRPLLRILRREFHPLTFPQQLEDGSPDRAAVEKVLDPTLVADETESLVDEESCNCPGWHKRRLRSPMLENPRLSWNSGRV